jgi:4-amino-4-deoxy-L-arabinose transferase-like glycosyltransferase
VAAILVLHACAAGPLGRRGALLATLVLGTSIQFMALARVALTDLWLGVWILGSMAALHGAFEDARAGRPGTGRFLLACGLAGLAMLTKGLVGIGIPAAAAAFYLTARREWRLLFRLRWLVPGAAVALLVGGSWYLFLGVTSPDGFGFLEELIVEHHWKRFLEPREGHRGPVFYYVIVLAVGLFPWTPFWLAALAGRPGSQEDTARRRLLQLAGAFALVPFVLFSIASTKLPGYITPALPPLALAFGSVFDADTVERSWLWRTSVRSAALCWLAIGIVAAASPFLLRILPEALGEDADKAPTLLQPMPLGIAPWAGLAIGAVAALLLWSHARALRPPPATAWTLGASSLALFIASVVLVLPAYDEHFQAPLRALAVTAAGEAKGEVLLVAMSDAPSVEFHGGVRTRRVRSSEASALDKFRRGSDPLVGIVPERRRALLGDPDRITVIDRRGGYAVFRYEAEGTVR